MASNGHILPSHCLEKWARSTLLPSHCLGKWARSTLLPSHCLEKMGTYPCPSLSPALPSRVSPSSRCRSANDRPHADARLRRYGLSWPGLHAKHCPRTTTQHVRRRGKGMRAISLPPNQAVVQALRGTYDDKSGEYGSMQPLQVFIVRRLSSWVLKHAVPAS